MQTRGTPIFFNKPINPLRLPRLVICLHKVRFDVKGQYAVVTRMSILFCRMPSAVTRAALDFEPSGATIQTPEQVSKPILFTKKTKV